MWGQPQDLATGEAGMPPLRPSPAKLGASTCYGAGEDAQGMCIVHPLNIEAFFPARKREAQQDIHPGGQGSRAEPRQRTSVPGTERCWRTH